MAETHAEDCADAVRAEIHTDFRGALRPLAPGLGTPSESYWYCRCYSLSSF